MNQFKHFALLKNNRDFGFLYFGQLISLAGTVMTEITLSFQIYQRTHSTFMVGLLSLCQLLPLLVTALLGGVFADRYKRKLLLLSAESTLAVFSLVLVANAMFYHNIVVIFICAFIMAGLSGLHRPALDSMVQQIVAKKDLVSVGQLATFKFSLCLIGGPALAGLLIAHYGVAATYAVDFITFTLSIGALLAMHDIPKPIVTDHESVLYSVKTGFKYALSKPELIGTYLVDFTAMVFAMPNALFPAITASYGNPRYLGLLYSAPAVGALLIAIFGFWTSSVKRQGRAVGLAALFWGVSIICFGLAQSIYLKLFFLAISGMFDAISGIFRSAMWNEIIPNNFRGRLAGIEMISYLSGPRLGDTEAGFVASLFSVPISIISGGILCVISVSLCCYYLPKFWQYRSQAA